MQNSAGQGTHITNNEKAKSSPVKMTSEAPASPQIDEDRVKPDAEASTSSNLKPGNRSKNSSTRSIRNPSTEGRSRAAEVNDVAE